TINGAETFKTPLTVSSLRILPKKPSDVEQNYEFAIDIFACYEETIAEIATTIATSAAATTVSEAPGCTEIDGMLASQFIADRNVVLRGTSRVPDAGRNVFSIVKSAWPSKPRLDILLASDGTPVQVTKVALNSAVNKDTFRIKFKSNENEEKWSDFVVPGDDTITIFEESKTFATPLTASSLRILVNKPSNVEDLYEFSLDIFACYEDVIAETVSTTVTLPPATETEEPDTTATTRPALWLGESHGKRTTTKKIFIPPMPFPNPQLPVPVPGQESTLGAASTTTVAGCIEVNGMLSPQFVPKKNIDTRSVSRIAKIGRNVFTIKNTDWAITPRIDVLLTPDGEPVQVTKVMISSGPNKDKFTIKYKETEDDSKWTTYIAPGEEETIIDEEVVFEVPLRVTSVRVLPKEPSSSDKLYTFTLDIFACYENVIVELKTTLKDAPIPVTEQVVTSTPGGTQSTLAKCTEVDGMLSPNLVAARNIKTRDVARMPKAGRNFFAITAAEFAANPRIDVILTKEKEAVPVTRVILNSGPNKDKFKLRYKSNENDSQWSDYLDGKIIEEGIVFKTPLLATSIRILPKATSTALDFYSFTLEIFACYDEFLVDTVADTTRATITTTTSSPVCQLKEGMSTPKYLPSSSITSVPESDTVSLIRPNVDGDYIALVNQKPQIIVKLVDEGDEPIPVGQLVLIGNAPKMTVLYKQKDEPEAPFTPVSEEGQVKVYEADDNDQITADFPERILATVLQIKPEFGNDAPEQCKISELKVFACFHEEQTTVTTTPAGLTTVSTTTTKFTSVGTTESTILTTLKPETETGCVNIDGMLDSQIIPDENIVTRAVDKKPEVGRNYFTIARSQWLSKPRVDITVAVDGAPVEVTKIVVDSGAQGDSFRVKYKENESDAVWSDYKETGQDQIKTVKELVEFEPPLVVAMVRVLLDQANEPVELYGFTLDVTACYRRFTSVKETTIEATVQVCQLKDGMDTPLYIPKNHITSEPQTNDIEKIRSNVDDEWSVPAKDEPAIVVQLIEAQDEPIPVGGLVLNTNVEKFNVFYKQAISDQEEFKPITFKDTLQEAQDFDTDEPVDFPERIYAGILKIVPLPEDNSEFIKVDDLKILACFHKTISTVSTTESVTTQRTTTVAFTPTSTVITAVSTTVQPNEIPGCVEVDGMTDPRLVPSSNIQMRAMELVSDVAPNYFTISKDDWISKPKVDIKLTVGGTPIMVTKLIMNSGLDMDRFRVKYKLNEEQLEWSNYVAPGDTKATTMVIEEVAFKTPLNAAYLRILPKKPQEVDEIYGFHLDIFGCYEQFITTPETTQSISAHTSTTTTGTTVAGNAFGYITWQSVQLFFAQIGSTTKITSTPGGETTMATTTTKVTSAATIETTILTTLKPEPETGCVNIDGMLDAQIIPDKNIVTRAVDKKPEVGHNFFTIARSQWLSKPRVDITVAVDGAPVEVTKIVVDSGAQGDVFRVKYKENESDAVWSDYKELGQDVNKIIVDEENFAAPLMAAKLRILLQKPETVDEQYGFTIQITACYERLLSNLDTTSTTQRSTEAPTTEDTSTLAPTKGTPACPMKDGMSTPTLISDEHITSTPDSDTIKNVRPGSGSKWEEDADKEPTITVTLVDEDEDPVPIGVIKVTGNVPSFTVLYQTADDELTPVTKPGSKEPQIFDETNKEGKVTASFRVVTKKVVIVPTKPTDDDKVVIEDLEVFACFKEQLPQQQKLPKVGSTALLLTMLNGKIVINQSSTTTPAPTQATPACPVKDGMSTPTLISDEHITSTPDSDAIKNVRPGSGSKWEEDADKEPTITVTLVDEDEDPVPIGVIKVTGNVPSFTVLYQTADDELTPVTKPGSKEPQIFDETNKEGKVTASFRVVTKKVVIVPTKPTDDDKVVIEDLEVFACFKEVESTTTTTPEGTKTTKATTTQFTTAETVVTTVASTFTPGEPTVATTTAAAPVPTTTAPASAAPSTRAPTTQAPSTQAPTTQAATEATTTP
ncbi:hypothetical protein CAPTEDRAFT_196226, partial [Capitella teleta]